jgi:histidine triad (HIT) family protein
MNSNDCIFCKIIQGEIPSTKVYDDDTVVAFLDINPVAPTHILIVPKEHIPSVNDLEPKHETIVGHLHMVGKALAAEQGIADSGYRLLINTGFDSGQDVYHLHLHLLGGRRLGPMG